MAQFFVIIEFCCVTGEVLTYVIINEVVAIRLADTPLPSLAVGDNSILQSVKAPRIEGEADNSERARAYVRST